jgi:hypothetical protein
MIQFVISVVHVHLCDFIIVLTLSLESEKKCSCLSLEYTEKNRRRIINPSKGLMRLINPFTYAF